jgi:vacuolar protein sorting-associated protein 45
VIGGATYEGAFLSLRAVAISFVLIVSFVPTSAEGRAIALTNMQDTSGPGQGAHFLLGGTTIHNSRSFLDMIQDAASQFPASITRPPQSNTTTPLQLGVTPVQDRGTATTSSEGGANSFFSSNGASRLDRGISLGPGSLLDPGRLGEVTENAKDIASGLFGRLRGAVDGISLQ